MHRVFRGDPADVTSDIFLPGSESPAALLYTAYENFEVRTKRAAQPRTLSYEPTRCVLYRLGRVTLGRQRKLPTADDYIRSIRRSLTEAVDACIEAAGHELAPGTQRSLLKVGRAAAFPPVHGA